MGNPYSAKELSETLCSPVSLTRVEKARAAGEELGVERRCSFRRLGFPLHFRLQASFISQLRIRRCSGNSAFAKTDKLRFCLDEGKLVQAFIIRMGIIFVGNVYCGRCRFGDAK
ncbi:hypothetical protein QQF64_028145 [Cirrhinus molitorella]|uniref:Uncharacterized protein n=1 Tax=Cirrhinus molitorella TaxID=172907 RepID=A0ABR3N5R6_9TELE